MSDSSSALEALRFISDWAKWLITIETGALAIIGAIVTTEAAARSESIRLLASGAIVSFVVSIAAAAVLLLTLPEIAQNLPQGTNIWLTSDSVIGRSLGLNTQVLATLESLFFGLGILCFAGVILAIVWSSTARTGPVAQKP